jgi:hypothetical protein
VRDDALSTPVDATAAAALSARGLRMAVVDPTDPDQTRAWVEADARGFHDAAPSDEFLAELSGDFPLQRTRSLRRAGCGSAPRVTRRSRTGCSGPARRRP